MSPHSDTVSFDRIRKYTNKIFVAYNLPEDFFSAQMELSALQSMMAVQEEELQVQAADMESLTRNIQIKEDLIKVSQLFKNHWK